MPRPKVTLRLFLAIIAGLALVSAGGAYLRLHWSLLPSNGRLPVPGLRAPVEVIRDRWGVPHIYAQREEDLFFAQGYVQAQDRLWQMEVCRRAAHGTLAEVLGERGLKGDRLARTLGFTRGAQAEWEMLDLETRGMLEAYVQGVNAALSASGQRLPVEFTLLGYAPAPWRPLDTLAWARLLAWSQNTGWEAEVLQARLVYAVGPERAAELAPMAAEAARSSGVLGELAAFEQPLLLEGAGKDWPWAQGTGGGNCWVLTGGRSASGSPILATDILMPLQMPSAWYEMHLVGGRYDVVGATIPGIPCVVLGRNRYIAWGYGDAGADVEDLCVERVRAGGSGLQAEYQGQWEDVLVRQEQICVRGQAEPVQLAVHSTRHGPLVTIPTPDRQEQLALRWVGDGRSTGYTRCLAAVNRAADWKQFDTALRDWAVPALGLACADSQGNIGYALAGVIPRRAGDAAGRFPVSGHSGSHEWRLSWSPERSGDQLLNPASQAIIAAANPLAFTGDSDLLTQSWPAPHRIKRAREVIEASDGLAVEEIQAMQTDLQGPEQPLLALLLALPPRGWVQERTTPYLRQWDRRYDAESVGAAVFETYYWRLVHNTLDDELGPDLVDAYLNASPDHRAVMVALSAQPENPWFDDRRTPRRESRDEIMARSYAEAVEWLGRRFGDLPYEWNWGRVHSITFRHALGQDGPLTLLLNRGAMRAGGGPMCVNATTSHYSPRLLVRAAPTYRLIIDLAVGGRALAMNAGGQSGNPLSPHYADLIEPWRQGRYHPLLFERELILQASESSLTLAPAD